MADVFEGLDAQFWTLAGREESQVRLVVFESASCPSGMRVRRSAREGCAETSAGITARTGMAEPIVVIRSPAAVPSRKSPCDDAVTGDAANCGETILRGREVLDGGLASPDSCWSSM